MQNIFTKKGIIVICTIVVLIIIAIGIAYIVTESDTSASNQNNVSDLGNISSDDNRSINNESFNSDNLLLELSNCYYEIYSSGLLKRNSEFDIDNEVKNHIIEFQKYVPTVLWVDYYAEQCSSIEK